MTTLKAALTRLFTAIDAANFMPQGTMTHKQWIVFADLLIAGEQLRDYWEMDLPAPDPANIDLSSIVNRAIAETGQLDPNDETTQQIATAIASAVSQAIIGSTMRCPLDGAAIKPFDDGLFVCSRCREILTPRETVAKATPETWAAYLVAGETDTEPEDAPLSRLIATPED